jgi:Ca2+:H+ antiporter
MYGVPAAQMQIGLLGITLLAIALPSAYHWAYPNSVSIASIPSGSPPGENEMGDLLKMSRGISFILLAIYAMFLTFQLYSKFIIRSRRSISTPTK